MEPTANNISIPDRELATTNAAAISQSFRLGCLTVQFLNAMAASYYFNYVFFYLKGHFGFADNRNLLFSALYGFVYMLTAGAAGPFAAKRGYFFTLRLGFSTTMTVMVIGGILPHIIGYSHTMQLIEWALLAVWTVGS
jgi:hypothetical protein